MGASVGASSGKNNVDVELNVVPFIDLMSCLTAFLLATAVWSAYSQINIKPKGIGRKTEQKIYYHHSGYHGGLKERTLADVLDKTPDRVLRHAVKGMLPKNSLGRHMLARLKLYARDTHPHEAQVIASQKAAVMNTEEA